MLTEKASASRSSAASKVLLNKLILLCKAQHCQCGSIPSSVNFMPVKPFYNTVSVSFIVLEKDFCFTKEAYLTFHLEVNSFTIKKTIGYF